MPEKPTPPNNVHPFPPIPRDEPPSVPVRIFQVQMSDGQFRFLTDVLRGRARMLRDMMEKSKSGARASERAMMAMEADSTDSLLTTVERTARELVKPEGTP